VIQRPQGRQGGPSLALGAERGPLHRDAGRRARAGPRKGLPVTEMDKTNTLERLARKKKTLRKSEQTAAEYILRYPERIALLPLRKLAEECRVSEATILRLCQALGFSGYQDFKISLIPQLLGKGSSLRQDVAEVDTKGQWLESLGGGLVQSIGGSLKNLDKAVLRDVARLVESASRIVIAGLGGSAGVAYVLADSLSGLGFLSLASHDPSYLQVIPGALRRSDLVIGISHSGETAEIALVLERAGEAGAATVAITNYEQSPVDRAARHTLFTSVSESLMGSYSCEPRIVQLAIVEALLNLLGSDRKRGKKRTTGR
jgi:RpiR family transcriptional regulator, carbohydrate utilization regulator